MATISKIWGAETTLYQTSAFGGTDAGVGSTEVFTSDVDLETNGYEGAHVVVEADFPATPTDNLVVSVYASLDGVNYDDTPLYAFEIDNGTDPNQVSFVVRDVAHFRIGLKSSGTTDTIDAQVKYQVWRWQSV